MVGLLFIAGIGSVGGIGVWGGKWGVGWMTATVAARSDAEMLPQILALFLQMRGLLLCVFVPFYRQFSAP